MNKNETVNPSLARPISKLLIPKKRNQFRLENDPVSENWNDFLMNKEIVRIHDDKLRFGDSAVVFTLKGDTLSMMTDYDFKKTNSPGAKQFINFLEEIQFDIHAKDKSFRDENLIKNYSNKRTLLASGLQKVIFLSENSNEICVGIYSLIQEKQARNHTSKFDDEIIAKVDKLLENKSNTPKQHKQTLNIFNQLHTKIGGETS